MGARRWARPVEVVRMCCVFRGAESVGAGAACAARPDGSSLLEPSQNVVTVEGEDLRVFEVSPCGCDCWYCPDCCKRKGYRLRAELIPILKTFAGLMMLTLTVDPMLFPSAREAYLYVRGQRAISRLMRDLHRAGHLHSPRYFYVVEFQKRTEQAHFHVLVDATRIPKEAIDAAWSKFRPSGAGPVAANRPAFGMTRFSMPRFEGGAEHAARYATKYLVKSPDHGWPSWVMAMGKRKRVPRYQTSRGFWGRMSEPARPAESTRTTDPKSYAERVAECGSTSNLFEAVEFIDESTGEVERSLRWHARLPQPVAFLRDLLASAEPGAVRLRLVGRDAAGCIEAIKAACGRAVGFVNGVGLQAGEA